MRRHLAIALSILMCAFVFPEAASAQSTARKVSGPYKTGKKRTATRSKDARRVKKTRKVKRHYRKPHEDSSSSNAAAAETVIGILGLIVEIAAAADEFEDSDDDYEYADAGVYEDDEWNGESVDAHFVVRTNAGLAARFVDGYYDDGQAGITYGARFGVGDEFTHLGLSFDIDDYSAFGPAIFMFRPGIDFLLEFETGWPVRPVVGLGVGAFFDVGPDSAGAAGVSFDLEGGLVYQVSEKVDISLTIQLDILTQPEEDEYGESTLGVVGLRQSFVLGTGFVF